MRSDSRELLVEECHRFCRYLCGSPAHRDVVATYCRAHELGCADPVPGAALESALMRVAEFAPAAADSFAAVFAKTSLLRRKLVLLVAILESRADSAALLDQAASGSRAVWAVAVAGHLAGSAAKLAIGAILVSVWHAWYALSARAEPEPARQTRSQDPIPSSSGDNTR